MTFGAWANQLGNGVIWMERLGPYEYRLQCQGSLITLFGICTVVSFLAYAKPTDLRWK